MIFLLYPLWRVARASGHPERVLRLGPAPLAAYPLATVALVTGMPVATAIGSAIVPMPGPLDDIFGEMLRVDSARDWVMVLLAAAVVPALGEELLFRGFLQRGLERRLGPAPAIAISSVVFGVIHGPSRAIAAALLGGLLGWMAWRANSVRPVIAAHFLSNASIVVLANLAGGELVAGWSESPSPVAAALAAVPALAALLLYTRVTRGVRRGEEEDGGDEPRGGPETPPTGGEAGPPA
jgi:membrane protease YdiL (CAAX protease family)